MNIPIREILNYLDSIGEPYAFFGDDAVVIHNYAPLKEIKDDSIIWARKADYLDFEELKKHKNLLLIFSDKENIIPDCNFIKTKDPYRVYFKILSFFWESEDYEKNCVGIAESAIVKTNEIGKNIYIGEGTFIDKDVSIADNVIIQHNVTIQGRVIIGEGTFIQSGASIGSSGFGYMVEDDGSRVCVPHLGGVKIGKNVRIGSLACIQRGCLSDTIIEDNVCIDNLVHISHNAVIKKGALIVVGSICNGSSEIGTECWIGPGTIINDGVTVARRTYAGSGSVILKDTIEQKVVVGVPAKVLRDRDMSKDLD